MVVSCQPQACVITRRKVVCTDVSRLRIGPIFKGETETSVLNLPMLRNNPEEGGIQFNRSGNVRYGTVSSLVALPH
jgi:hypothetical protein